MQNLHLAAFSRRLRLTAKTMKALFIQWYQGSE